MKKVWGTIISLCLMGCCFRPVWAEEDLQLLIIQLNWVPNVQFAGILVAKEHGWYEEAGIDVIAKRWEDGITPIQEVISGNAHLAMAEGIELIRAAAEGHTLKAIAADFQKSPFCLMSKEKLGIQSPEDLAGKRIGIDSPETELMVKIVLASEGIDFSDITPVPVGWNLLPFIADEVDVYPAFMNDQPLTMKEQGYAITYLPAFKYGYDFYSGVYIVQESLLQTQPELLQNFLKITMKGWQEAFRNPYEAAKRIVSTSYPDGNIAQQAESLKLFRMLALLGEGKKFPGIMEEHIWQEGINILVKYRQIDRDIPANELFTVDILKETYFRQ